MFQRNSTIEEKKYYKALERLDNSFEMLVIVFKDLGLKQKPWDIKRKLNVLKFNCPKEENNYYLEFEPYIDRIIDMSENEIRKYFLTSKIIQDDIKELNFKKEDNKLKEVQQDLQILGFTDKQCKLICFRELTIEEEYEIKLAKKDKEIVKLKTKVKNLENSKPIIKQQILGF